MSNAPPGPTSLPIADLYPHECSAVTFRVNHFVKKIKSGEGIGVVKVVGRRRFGTLALAALTAVASLGGCCGWLPSLPDPKIKVDVAKVAELRVSPDNGKPLAVTDRDIIARCAEEFNSLSFKGWSVEDILGRNNIVFLDASGTCLVAVSVKPTSHKIMISPKYKPGWSDVYGVPMQSIPTIDRLISYCQVMSEKKNLEVLAAETHWNRQDELEASSGFDFIQGFMPPSAVPAPKRPEELRRFLEGIPSLSPATLETLKEYSSVEQERWDKRSAEREARAKAGKP